MVNPLGLKVIHSLFCVNILLFRKTSPKTWSLRPVYTGVFCCDLSPFDACD